MNFLVSSQFYIVQIKCNKRVNFVFPVTNVTDIGKVHSAGREYVPVVNFCIRCRLKLDMESLLT